MTVSVETIRRLLRRAETELGSLQYASASRALSEALEAVERLRAGAEERTAKREGEAR